jgi:hypothetical protein
MQPLKGIKEHQQMPAVLSVPREPHRDARTALHREAMGRPPCWAKEWGRHSGPWPLRWSAALLRHNKVARPTRRPGRARER